MSCFYCGIMCNGVNQTVCTRIKHLRVPLDHQALTPPVFLAPLAGITDLPFRNLVLRFGAGLVVSEMIASQDMIHAKRGVREKAELGLGIENTAVQLAGREAHWLAEAARMAEANGARIIDINMGCPAKKVTSASGEGACGSALLKDLDHALALIEAVVGAVDLPVTLKTRLGWDDASLNAPELATRAQEAGIQMITIHGRTRCQFYKGHADWAAIAAIKAAVQIPVVANGDITDSTSAQHAMQQSGADGVMIGRGAQGRPWALAEVAHDLFGAAAPDVPTGPRLADLVGAHYEEMLEFYGCELGLRVARKHLGWYMDHAGTDPSLRREVLTSRDSSQVLGLIAMAMDAPTRQAA